MDQAFSVKNLSFLLKEDRKKGGRLEEIYIPSAFSVRLKIYEIKKMWSFFRYKLRVGIITEAAYLKRGIRVEAVLAGREIQHKKLVNSELERISKLIIKKEFRVKISLLPSTIGGKKVYGIGNNLDQILAVRFIQHTLKTVYEVKMPPRDILVSQIKSLALDGVPKYIIKADVEQFYESIRHKDLLDGIHQDPELSIVVKRILTRLIKDYVNVSGDDKGLPRGIGVSAYLSEIYLNEIDKKIKTQNDLFYYCRYVDDIILMYSPERKDAITSYLPTFCEILKSKGLNINSKTKELNLLDVQKGKFEYLGYEFDLSPSMSGVRLSMKKLNKYRERIKKSFIDYANKEPFISQKASDELVMRLRFLTGNIRLFNRKSNAFIGIYFSNKFITDTSQLDGLDKLFQSKITPLTDASLKRRLKKLSFKIGFNEKIFRNFSPNELSEISQGWNHG